MIHVDVLYSEDSLPLPTIGDILELLAARRLMWWSRILVVTLTLTLTLMTLTLLITVASLINEASEDIRCLVDELPASVSGLLLWLMSLLISALENTLIQDGDIAKRRREQAERSGKR